MKTRQSRRQTTKVSHSRWAAYAAAGAATALAGSNSLEAAIHYSGRLEVVFPRNRCTGFHGFQLDQPGNSLVFSHCSNLAFFNPCCPPGVSAFRASAPVHSYLSVSKLSFGQRISAGQFGYAQYVGVMANHSRGQWADPGVGFIGFRFNSGAGFQYDGHGSEWVGPRRTMASS
jgi:hypothetical protein